MKCTRPNCGGDLVPGEDGSYCILCNRLAYSDIKAEVINHTLNYGIFATEEKYGIEFDQLVGMLETWLADKDKRHLCRLHGKTFRMKDRLPDILRLPFT